MEIGKPGYLVNATLSEGEGDAQAYTSSAIQEILDALPFYVMLVDADHHILLANKTVSRDFGLEPEQIVGGYCPQVVHSLDSPFPGCPLEEAVVKGCAVERELFDPHSGQWLESAIYPIGQQTQNGRAIFLHMVHDITERKRAEEEIRQRVEELILLNRIGRTLTSSLDLEQVLTTVMEETARVLRTEAGSVLLLDEESNELGFRAAVGPRSDEVKGSRLLPGQGIAGWVAREGQRLLVPDVGKDPRFYPGIDEATGFMTRSVLAVPLKVKGKVVGVIEAVNKTEGHFSQTDVALLSSMAQPAAIAIENAQLFKDLQDRMEELKRTQTQLIRSAKLAAIGELAAGVAHEVNNPLTAIIGFTSLLLQRVDDGDPMKEDLQIIDREADRTRTIVRGLLDFARQKEPRLEPADVNEIVRSTMNLVRHQAKVTRVTMRESCDETLPPVWMDADQIKQVFLNMTTNAIQAMPEGGELEVMTAYRPQATDGADYVAVEFHDTGMGISSEDLPRIFDPFFTTKEAGQGTGLGLSISHSIVKKHRGKIEVESKVGRGSTFTVMLPVAEGQRVLK